MNTTLKIACWSILLLFSQKSLRAQPGDRDYLKYRQEKLQEFLKSLEPKTPGTKAERAPEAFQLSELAKSGFSLPENGEWFNTKFPPTLKDQHDSQSTVIVFDLFDLRSEAFIHEVVRQLGKFKNLKIRGVVKQSNHVASDETVLRRLQKINPEFPFVLVKDFKTLKGIDTLAVPSAVLVQTGLKAAIQIKSVAEIEEMAALCRQLEPTFKAADNRSKGTSFSPDNRLTRNPESVLFYPTCAIMSKGVFYISDSGNNRILVLNKDGDVIQVIGNRKPGLRDDKGDGAMFWHPTGLAFDENENVLYISDTHNHCIRKLDPESGAVTTVLGTGKEATGSPQLAAGKNDPISFPSEITLFEGKLYIAMAGLNQVWVMDLKTNEAKPQIGAAPKKKKKSSNQTFNLPTGLAVTGSKSVKISSAYHGQITQTGGKTNVDLIDSRKGIKSIYDIEEMGDKTYFTDPVGNALWVIEDGNLREIIGKNGPGLVDGIANEAQLYFPCGINRSGGVLLISDAYNDAIRIYDPAKNELRILPLGDYDMAIADIRNPVGNEGVIYADQLEIGEKSTITVKILLPEGMVINAYKNNRVELMEEDGIEFTGADFEENFLEFVITKTASNRQLYFEMELHLSDTKKPGQVFYRPCRVLIPLLFSETGNSKAQCNFKVFP